MPDDLLKNNLNNLGSEQKDLFGRTYRRLNVMHRIGFVPISIWRPDWNIVTDLKKIIGDDGSTRELVGKKMQLMGSKYSVSIFNPHLAQMILSAYCPEHARIFDPFGGGGTRGFIAAAMGHEYLGIEIRQNEVDRILAQQNVLGHSFDILCMDCRDYQPEPYSFNFSYTCPPYYDLEQYSEMEGDMSHASTYEQFLEMIKASLRVTYKALAPDSLAVWVVGNFRDAKGELRHFNGDLARLGKEVGFVLHDELIFWGASNAAAQRAGQFVANRKSVRVHEYVIVFKKI